MLLWSLHSHYTVFLGHFKDASFQTIRATKATQKSDKLTLSKSGIHDNVKGKIKVKVNVDLYSALS